MFTSKPSPRSKASISNTVDESSPEMETPDVSLIQGPVPTRPSPPPSQSATCQFPLLPAFPAWVSIRLSCPPLRPSCPPWEHTPVSFPRARGGEGREPACPGMCLLSACWAELSAVQDACQIPALTVQQGHGPWGCFPAVCLCLWLPCRRESLGNCPNSPLL